MHPWSRERSASPSTSWKIEKNGALAHIFRYDRRWSRVRLTFAISCSRNAQAAYWSETSDRPQWGMRTGAYLRIGADIKDITMLHNLVDQSAFQVEHLDMGIGLFGLVIRFDFLERFIFRDHGGFRVKLSHRKRDGQQLNLNIVRLESAVLSTNGDLEFRFKPEKDMPKQL